MCHLQGSIEQATSICPMCKLFAPTKAMCPHIKEICRNQAMHPRGDVIYLKNAEVSTFNGCGYCKWAKTNPTPAKAGFQNAGWPGCCRPPKDDEKNLIKAADWISVSAIHKVPIPADIKALLDAAKVSAIILPAGCNTRSTASQGSPKGASVAISPTKVNGSPRATTVAIPVKARSNGSPQQVAVTLSPQSSKTQLSPSSLPKALTSNVTLDDAETRRQPSPGKRHSELQGSVSRRSGDQRPTISASALRTTMQPPAGHEVRPSITRSSSAIDSKSPPAAPAKASAKSNSPPRASKRSVSVEHAKTPVPVADPVAPISQAGKQPGTTAPASGRPGPTPVKSSGSASSAASSGSSVSETTTITSEGFTDYLSDESEAELQRQAEVKAAQAHQNLMEEAEFNAARKQLQPVGLKPPKGWNPGAGGSTSRSTPRSHAAATVRTYTAPSTYSAFATPAHVDAVGGVRAK